MFTFLRLMTAELIKIRRSAALRLVWLLPLLFILLDYALVGNFGFKAHYFSAEEIQLLAMMPLKGVGTFWVGYFHPLLLALLPALLFRPEHQSCLWKHLNAMPVSPKAIFLCKTMTLLLLTAATLVLVVIGLWMEWSMVCGLNSAMASFAFPWMEMGKLIRWLLLGSLPLLSFYSWIAEKISSGAIPILFGLIGLVFNISLSGHELDPSWQRDLIPWVLPYSCAQQAIEKAEARQDAHLAGALFGKEIDLSGLSGTEVYYLPSGRKVTTTTTIPDYFLHPPPPTPRWLLAAFSAGAGMALLSLGLLQAKRNRT